MEGTDVVTYDEDKLGTVLEQRDDFVIIESGHMFKSKHAIPRDFIHEQSGLLVATVAKDVVMDSPKIDNGNFDAEAVRRHYGLEVPFEVDPDPERPAGPQEPQESLEKEVAHEKPVVRDRQPNAADPGGATANMTDRNRTGGRP